MSSGTLNLRLPTLTITLRLARGSMNIESLAVVRAVWRTQPALYVGRDGRPVLSAEDRARRSFPSAP